jgi:hypothetical protein
VSAPTFPLVGTVSYNPGGVSDVRAGQSVSVARDSTVDWNFQEQALAGYPFISPVCTSQNGLSTFNGQSGPICTPVTFTTNVLIDVDLAPSDLAACTSTSVRNVVDLTMLKQTIGGVGTFAFTVMFRVGAAIALSSTTTTEGVPAEAWTSAPSTCSMVDNPAALETLACTFVNTFIPTGSITKATEGVTGNTESSIVPVPPVGEGQTVDPVHTAGTVEPSVAVTASKISDDYSLDSLALERCSIVEWDRTTRLLATGHCRGSPATAHARYRPTSMSW